MSFNSLTRFCFLFLTLVASPLLGQVTGRLSGTVLDPDGNSVAGARVLLFLADSTVEEAATVTDARGDYLFPSLRPTYYDLTIEAPNFKKQSQKGVKVDPLTETPLAALKLELGATRETVETKADAQVLQTASGQVSAVLSNEQISRLPLSQRDPLALLAILPGVSSNGRAAANTINGQSPTFSNITYDGINIQTSFLRGNALGSTTNRLRTDQLSEATIVTANPGAAFSGGSIQVAFSPPSGTNRFHGTGYWNYGNPELAAQTFNNNRNATPRMTRSNQIGGSFAGPLVKDKLFFFLNYESFLNRSTVTRRGVVPESTLTSVDPEFARVLALFPRANVVGTSSNYRGTQNSHETVNTGLGRLDYLRSSQNLFGLTLSIAKGTSDDVGSSGPFQRSPNSYTDGASQFYAGTWRFSAKSGKLTNELRIGGNLPSLDGRNRLRGKFGYILAFPFYGQPMEGIDPQGRDDFLFTYQNTLNYTAGRHNLQAGVSLQQYRFTNYGIMLGGVLPSTLTSISVPSYPACYVVTTAACTKSIEEGLVDYIALRYTITSPTSGYRPGAGGGELFKSAMDLWSGFLQDNWKVTPRLSLNIGLRYDFQSPVRDRTGISILPVISDGSFASLYDPNLKFSFAGNRTNRDLYRADRNNFSPNIGFAWTPFSSRALVFRGAYNINYVNDEILRNTAIFNQNVGFQYLSRTTSLSSNGVPGIRLSSPFLEQVPTLLLPKLPAELSVSALRALAGNSASVYALNPDLRTPSVQQWNFAVETSVWKTILSARYVGNNLIKGLRNIDTNPNGSNRIWLLSNLGRSNYNALQLEAARRTRSGLAFDVNYTFSKALSDLGDYNQGQFDPHLDIRNPRLNRAPAPFDLRHAFKSTFVYDIPVGRRSGAVSALINNWSLSGILLAQSGAPFSIVSSGQTPAFTTLTAGEINSFLQLRKNGDGVSFVNAPAGTFRSTPVATGVLQRRMFNGPNTFTVNLGVRKLFVIAERKSIEFRTEAFNLLNRANWLVGDSSLRRNPNGSVPDGTVDRNVVQMNEPRRIQFQLRVNF